jgi:hypothetical protein
VLFVALRRREGRLRGREIAASIVRIAAASAVMGGLLWVGARTLSAGAFSGWRGAVLLAGLILAATGVYWLAAHLMGAPEPAELRRIARRRRA